MDRNRHEKGRSVPSDISLAEDWATALERIEAQRSGENRSRVRPVVARRTGVSEGTLYSLARRRLKKITNDTLRRLGNGLIAELQRELGRIEHELQIHTQIGTHIDSGEVLALVASRQKIKAALGLTDLPPSSGGEK